jgi:enoyl-CoA hydratase/carnithine racemase
MLLTGEFMSAERLLKAGWINEMVPAENLMPTAMRLAEKISENAPLSVRAAKENWYKSIEPFCQAGLKISREIFAPLYASEDAKEGPRAFAEKRKPVWKGR